MVRAVLVGLCCSTLFISGCSINQVQMWMMVNGHSVTKAEARNIADIANKDAKAGCDSNYWTLIGDCVPDNKTEVHCAGESGGGLAIDNIVAVIGWDHYELDPDGDGIACDGLDPIGDFEYARQGANSASITVKGWALDENVTDSIKVRVTDNGKARIVTANGRRTDINWLGLGPNHGFSTTFPATPGVHRVCVTALNRGGGSDHSLGCTNVDVDWRTLLLNRINSERAAVAAPALQRCDTLDTSAAGHATWMAQTGEFDVVGSNGSLPPERAIAAGYPEFDALFVQEVISAGQETVEQLVDGYMSDPQIREIILEPTLVSIGIGRRTGKYVGSPGELFWVQDFGDIPCE